MPARSWNQKAMRWVTIVCIALITGVCYRLMAAEKNLEGFQETRWGMTEDQLQEIYHGKLEHWTKTVGGVATPATKYPEFGLQHYDIDQCDFSVNLQFKEKRLSSVTLDLNDMNLLTKLGCPNKIIDILVRKYGAPDIDQPSKDHSTEIHTRTWFLGNTTLREVDVFWPGVGSYPSRNMLDIHYDPSQTPGAKQL